ncbi:AAA family ATPase [Streptomyces calidiresistens]|uniref:AAA family ATPase n=1 Tax=Streptomyces calidiresistens TaxID=1485586 RepID=UPI002B215408|nr:AAA family ATPase [Streptomyces calidiresistens]
MPGAPPRSLLLIGGPSGVGKSTVAAEVSDLLRCRDTAHSLIEGDFLGHVHPAPPGDPDRSALTERNLAAVWAHHAALGHHRLVYTNTVSVLEEAMFRRALGPGGPLTVTRVLLTAEPAVLRERLARREAGSGLAPHVERSLRAAERLVTLAPEGTVRVRTDGRPVPDIAREVLRATGW